MADWTTGQPAYRQVADALRDDIHSGKLAEGDQLPSYAALQERFDVSITVARAAVAELRTDGLVATAQGKGGFVLPGASAAARGSDAETTALRADLAALTERVTALEKRCGASTKRATK